MFQGEIPLLFRVISIILIVELCSESGDYILSLRCQDLVHMFVLCTEIIMWVFVKRLRDRVQYALVADVSEIQARSNESVN